MKELLGCIRKADKDFGLIQDGDTVCVGVSGGKDSLALLYAMSLYRRFCPNKYRLVAATLHLGREPFDLSGIQKMCDELEVEYVIKRTQISEVIFDVRKEANPCALCAKMRRGALIDLCKELGANKLALGHHRDDAEETLLLSMLYEGRIHTFHPMTFLSRSGITQIRPMVYASEKHIIHLVKKLGLPVVPSPCPANGETKREEMTEILDYICKKIPNARELLLSALQNTEQYGLWEKQQP
ncbi:MAG: tRNA 2-thiocytidine biosynthesis protein TtcA [Clostridia bacterium]|jgi:Predicted ATPase of the PP-loop superfamily implicated in cell cycle control|nr:tRNA 2-thiocytidine biosynthesis protein TtcA [Clostridia bacterium]MBR5380656.1 tRNA 2-thiocytidine biosynthesis protein TtcA [Clostridia bacterium]MBR5752476.1 tRNA 2-thiocytidine biosynthesis protein TtcA [Clostridia bacterium]